MNYAYGGLAPNVIPGGGGGQYTTVTETGTGLTARSTTRYTNSQAKTVRVVDGESGTTDYAYDPFGNVITVTAPKVNSVSYTETLTYDVRGRKKTSSNADSGLWTYDYSGAGELVKQTDAMAQVTELYYDALGRMTERREHPGAVATIPFVTVFSYDAYADNSPCTAGKGKLCEVRTATIARTTTGGALANPQTQRKLTYDAQGRPTQEDLSIADGATRSYSTYTTYDANSRLDKLVYPSNYTLTHRYAAWNGQLDQVADCSVAPCVVHWQANSRYPDGQIQTMQVGNVATTKTYDGFGRVAAITSSAQNASYTFDALANLTSRKGPETADVLENLSYDRLNRLTSSASGSASYSADGNLLTHSGTTATYAAGGHRRNGYSYDGNGNVYQFSAFATTTSLAYTPFNLPSSITATSNASRLDYLYDGSHARVRELSTVGKTVTKTYYVGAYEEHTRSDGVVEQRHYLNTPEGPVGMYTIRGTTPDTRYWHQDHLGSVALITDAAGSVKQKYKFDAWGVRTQQTLVAGEFPEERGYAGHEQLVEVGLIHMNGRLYDPASARFLQADPLVQDPLNGQNFNRYSYVLNNPLSYTDPTGFSFWTKWRRPIIAIAAAAAIAVGLPAIAAAGVYETVSVEEALLINTVNEVAPVAAGFAAGGIQGGNIQSAVQGAIFAGINGAIGTATISGAFGENAVAANVALHGAVGCAQAAAAGGSCAGGAAGAAFSAAAGPLIQGPMPVRLAASVLIGGTASRLAGGSFVNGATTASFEYLFNYCAHATAGCFKAWAENTIGFFGGAASIAAGIPLCATGPGCLAGAPMTIFGSQQVGEAINWLMRGDEETRGFNLLREGFREASASLTGNPNYGEAFYYGSAALTTGYAGVVGVSIPKWSPLLNDYLWVTEPRWSTLNTLQRGFAFGSVGTSAYKGTSALFGP